MCGCGEIGEVEGRGIAEKAWVDKIQSVAFRRRSRWGCSTRPFISDLGTKAHGLKGRVFNI